MHTLWCTLTLLHHVVLIQEIPPPSIFPSIPILSDLMMEKLSRFSALEPGLRQGYDADVPGSPFQLALGMLPKSILLWSMQTFDRMMEERGG